MKGHKYVQLAEEAQAKLVMEFVANEYFEVCNIPFACTVTKAEVWLIISDYAKLMITNYTKLIIRQTDH